MGRKHRHKRLFKLQSPPISRSSKLNSGQPTLSSKNWAPFNDLVKDQRVKVHYTEHPEFMAAIVNERLKSVPKSAVIVLADCVIEVVA